VVDGATLAPWTVIGSDCTIGQGAAVTGPFTRIRSGSTIGAGAQVGGGIEGGLGLDIGSNTLVDSGLFLASGAVVSAGSHLREDILACILANGTAATGTVGQCQALGATILGTIGSDELPPLWPQFWTKTDVIDPGALPPGLANLANDVNALGVAPMSNGGPAPDYVAITNDCDDFAGALELGLEGLGYEATFTVLYEIDLTCDYWDRWISRLTNAHALTDVHSGSGTLWIEPQRTAPGALGAIGDKDGDGKIRYDSGPGDQPPEGNLRIEVYSSRKEAEKYRALD
jgi:hypothetical protein